MERSAKVIYAEPGQAPRAISGIIEDAGEFLKVRNDAGEMTISKKIVLIIKNAQTREARQ
jgi:hypothetical protein